MKDQEFINGAEFGRRVGVKKSAISRAITRGAIIRQKKGIDPQHPLNLKYAQSIKDNRDRIQAVSLDNAIKKEVSETTIEDQPPKSELKTYTPEERQAHSDSKNQKNELLRAQTTKAQIELAKLMGVLILREDVERFWGRVVGSLHTFIMPLDERLADDLAAICGVTDHEIVLEVREAIKKEVVMAMGQVQNTAAGFSAILTSSL